MDANNAVLLQGVTKRELELMIANAMTKAIQMAPKQQEKKSVSGIGNICKALAIGETKFRQMISNGDLKRSVRRNGNVYICDVNAAFDELGKL